MITPLRLYLALLAGSRTAAFEFDWTLCDKETACFFGGGGCSPTLTVETAKPTALCDVTLSIRAYNNDKKALLVRLLLQGTALDYGKGASLTVAGHSLSCVAKAGKVAVETSLHEELITHSSDAAHLYCEAIVRLSVAILPAPQPATPAAAVTVAYTDATGAPKTLEMPYAGFHDAIAAAVTCDPGLILFDTALRAINETTRKVPNLRHAASCGKDPLWELVFEPILDKGQTEPAEEIKCVKDATTALWGWHVEKRGGMSMPTVDRFRAHCVASVCLLCATPTPCTEAGCANAKFRAGEKKAGGVTCAQLECPPGHLYSSADNRTASHATCIEVAPNRYSWTIDQVPVDTVQCAKQIEPALPPPPPPPTPVQSQMSNTLVIGVCAGVLGLVFIVIVIYCVVCFILKRKRGKPTLSTTRQSPLEMYTGRTPDSDLEYAMPATGKLTEKTISSKELNNAANKTDKAKDEGKGTAGKNGDGKGKGATTPKAGYCYCFCFEKKTSPSSKTSKTNKKNKQSGKTGRSKTDETDDKRSREPTERDGDTERIPLKPPKGEASKRRAQNTATTKTEASAKDKTKDGETPRHSQEDDKPNSVEPFRNNTKSKEELSKERDDRTQETEKKDKKK
ncbi:hypothetical protein PRIPAC_88356 [Pristionchus pacificus]|uniref:Uncharacterized protein n=1 Tax=Pristionchus pacificus TaxID=54126 RepID=A0A2A6B410_PRIPA|nr:hypothetical protein PRIPAC_88356 [Pristionchus pacificus]|eukprot:PDM60616.1 hypothetical protein PRIPAC_53594 [Pristionchus pacificus]